MGEIRVCGCCGARINDQQPSVDVELEFVIIVSLKYFLQSVLNTTLTAMTGNNDDANAVILNALINGISRIS